MPTDATTKLRVPKSTKERLNRISTAGKFSAELLSDLLLTEALDQIESELPPTDILTHVQVLRKRLGKKIAHSQTEALIAWLANFSPEQMDQALQAVRNAVETPIAAGETRVRKAAAPPECPPPKTFPVHTLPAGFAPTTAHSGPSASSLNEESTAPKLAPRGKQVSYLKQKPKKVPPGPA